MFDRSSIHASSCAPERWWARSKSISKQSTMRPVATFFFYQILSNSYLYDYSKTRKQHPLFLYLCLYLSLFLAFRSPFSCVFLLMYCLFYLLCFPMFPEPLCCFRYSPTNLLSALARFWHPSPSALFFSISRHSLSNLFSITKQPKNPFQHNSSLFSML